MKIYALLSSPTGARLNETLGGTPEDVLPHMTKAPNLFPTWEKARDFAASEILDMERDEDPQDEHGEPLVTPHEFTFIADPQQAGFFVDPATVNRTWVLDSPSLEYQWCIYEIDVR